MPRVRSAIGWSRSRSDRAQRSLSRRSLWRPAQPDGISAVFLASRLAAALVGVAPSSARNPTLSVGVWGGTEQDLALRGSPGLLSNGAKSATWSSSNPVIRALVSGTRDDSH